MIGGKAVAALSKIGVHTIGDLQSQLPAHLEHVFGKAGLIMWQKANGIDDSAVEPYHERKSISSEHTFMQDVTDVSNLDDLLISITEQLTYVLRNENRYCACLTVKIRYSNFETFTQQVSIAPTHADHVLFPLIKRLFKKAYHKGRAIRLIGVKLSQLSEQAIQTGLFDDYEKTSKLYKAVDALNNKFGKKTISKAATLGISSRDFNPFKKD